MATLSGILLLGLTWLAASFLHHSGLVSNLFPDTIIWSILPYLLAAHLIYHAVHLPAAEQFSMVIINSLTPFLLLILGFALAQQRYSRGAVLVAMVLTVFWFWMIERRAQRRHKLRLIHLEAEAPQQLLDQLGSRRDSIMRQIEFVHWADIDQSMPACNGALVIQQPDSPEKTRQLAQLKLQHVRLYSIAFLAESFTGRKSLQVLTDPLWQPDGNPAYDTVKRITDCAVTALLSPVWIPLCVLIALVIKLLDAPGPVLYSQMRTGWHGRPFRIWKFRTMTVQTSKVEPQFAQMNDARVTRLGHFLRKSRLDEIPQLANVLLGHMSLIGPRPEQHAFVEKFATEIPSYPYRHLVRPGLTGWAQVVQGYAASAGETNLKLQYDLYYVSHYSVALDLLITAKTIKTILTGFGAR